MSQKQVILISNKLSYVIKNIYFFLVLIYYVLFLCKKKNNIATQIFLDLV